jgi:hypothetical protein
VKCFFCSYGRAKVPKRNLRNLRIFVVALRVLRLLCGAFSLYSRPFAVTFRVHSRLNFLFVERLEKAEMIQAVLEFYVHGSRFIAAQKIDELHRAGAGRHFAGMIVFIIDNPFGVIR